MKRSELRKIIKETLEKENDNSLKHYIFKNSQGNIRALKFKTKEQVEDEIEDIRERFNLLDSKSIYDEAYSKFEEIYDINPLLLMKQMDKILTESQKTSEEVPELIDEMGKFFVVTKPKTKKATVEEIVSEQTIPSFISGGTKLDDVVGFFKQRSDARRKATECIKEVEDQLKEVESAMEEFRKAKQDIDGKKQSTKDLILRLKPKTAEPIVGGKESYQDGLPKYPEVGKVNENEGGEKVSDEEELLNQIYMFYNKTTTPLQLIRKIKTTGTGYIHLPVLIPKDNMLLDKFLNKLGYKKELHSQQSTSSGTNTYKLIKI